MFPFFYYNCCYTNLAKFLYFSNLIIFVNCGSNSFDEINFLNSNGIKSIIIETAANQGAIFNDKNEANLIYEKIKAIYAGTYFGDIDTILKDYNYYTQNM